MLNEICCPNTTEQPKKLVKALIITIIIGIILIIGPIIYYIVSDFNKWGHIYAGISIVIVLMVVIIPGFWNLYKIYKSHGTLIFSSENNTQIPRNASNDTENSDIRTEVPGNVNISRRLPETASRTNSAPSRTSQHIRTVSDVARASTLNAISRRGTAIGIRQSNLVARRTRQDQPVIFMNESNTALFEREKPPSYGDLQIV